jgi:hypothetical protein
MTRDDVIRMAREAGITFVTEVGVASATPEWLERFAALIAAAEREECAQMAEHVMYGRDGCDRTAAAIRARGDK